MILANAMVCDENFRLTESDLRVEGDRIVGLCSDGVPAEERIDLHGCTILPGLIDIHIHGAAGADVCDGTPESVRTISEHLAKQGVTRFCPTTMTTSCLNLEHIIHNISACMDKGMPGAVIHGIHLEGPFLSAEKCGVQNGKSIMNPDIDYFKRLNESFPKVIRIVDIAPEKPCAMPFIDEASKICAVSVSHSSADYETVTEAIHHGLSHASHLFNAMTPINHRSPGAVMAVFDNERVTAELICDGIHLHPSIIRMAFSLLGRDRTIIVSDSMRAAGMPDGEYLLGGKKILVYDRRTSYANGRLAGSTTSLIEEIRNLLRYGISYDHVIRSATINPARRLSIDHLTGSIERGKLADLAVLDKDMNVVMTMVKGRIVHRTIA
jgi:N-acetylglucosamine-6-phosphate deacetylase